jgi:signal transduction histidine kinase
MSQAAHPVAGSRFRSQPATAVALWIVLAGDALYLVGLLLLQPFPEIDQLVNVWLSGATSWAPALVFWLVAHRMHYARLDVVLGASAVTSNAIADSLYTVLMGSDGYLPSPSIADAFYLAFYAFMLAALVVTVLRQPKRLLLSVLLDSAVAALGAASVLAVLVAPVLRSAASDGLSLASAVSVAYPLLDIVLVIVLVAMAAAPGLAVTARWRALVAGLLIFAGADIAFALLDHAGLYSAGSPLDATWAIGLAFIAWWADGLRADREAPAIRASTRVGLIAPGLAVASGITVLVIASQHPIPLGATVLAAATLGLAAVPVAFRQGMLARVLEKQEGVVGQLRALDRSKSDMIATLNHELRTPLTSIRGYLEVVLDGEGGALPPAAASMLRSADHSAERMQGLVNDMLMVSRLESRSNPMALGDVSLPAVVERVMETLSPTASMRGVEVTADVAPGVPRVRADALQLERAITNLAENALKFTASGGTVTLALSVEPSTDRPVVLRVRDTGIGIPDSELPHLFDRFFRASNAQAAAVPGTGLGLAIAKSLVEAHGGRIRADSELGVGTTFTIALPALPAVPAQPAESTLPVLTAR